MLANKLINALPASITQEIRERAALHTLQKGDVLLSVGQPMAHAFLVGNGVLRVARAAGQRLETTGFLQPGDWLMYSFDDQPTDSALELSAACAATVYAVPHDVAFRSVMSTPDVALLTLELALARHARQYAQIYVASGQVSPKHAVGLALAELAHRRAGARPFVEKSISQDMLADFTNLSREAVNRALRDLRDCGLVAKTGLGLELAPELEATLRQPRPAAAKPLCVEAEPEPARPSLPPPCPPALRLAAQAQAAPASSETAGLSGAPGDFGARGSAPGQAEARPWFDLLPPELRDAFRSLGRSRVHAKGAVLIEEGDVTREVLFVRKGAVLLQKKGDVDLVCVGVGRPGQGLVLLPDTGEYASPFTVTTLVDSEVTWLAISDVRRLLASRVRLAVALSGQVVRRTRDLRRATALLYRAASSRDKVCEAIRLVGEPCEEGVRLPAQLSHADLATVCGLSRSEVTRKLGELTKQGLVIKDRAGLVLAPAGLEQADQVRRRWAA